MTKTNTINNEDKLWNNFNTFNPGKLNDDTDTVITQTKKKQKTHNDDNNCNYINLSDLNNLNETNKNNESNKTKFKSINEYVSASTVKNYLLQDPILDWFDEYKKKRSYSNLSDVSEISTVSDISEIANNKNDQTKQKNKKLKNTNLLFQGGIDFENKINNHLKNQFGSNLIEINTTGRFGCTRENSKKTIEAMMIGYHVILQGVVFNDLNKTHGTFDLIVRSDFVNSIFNRPVLDDKMTTFPAPNLKGNYHYIVIDIKWTTMTLCANGYTIRNEGRFPSYKGQLAIYNCAIGNIQGYIPTKAYIMAKSWKIDKKNDYREGYNCFDLLGEIDYSDFDYKYINNTVNALGWIRTVRRHGDSWDLYNPQTPEMYPNCSNKLDAPWTKEKNEVAEKINELTNVWYVTVKNRQIAHNNGVKSWKDDKCNSEIMGFPKGNRARIIDEILNINRSSTEIIAPKYINNNMYNWKLKGPTDFFIDFETINCTFYNSNIDLNSSKTDSDLVFMIGVGHVENNEFVYKVFTIPTLTKNEEDVMFYEFGKYLIEKIKLLDPDLKYIPRLFHWSFAEQTNVNHVNQRHTDRYLKLFNFCQWVDMYNIFTSEPIVVKGSLDFKLKNIGKAMFSHGLINTAWNELGPTDGLSAMLTAVDCYKNNQINGLEFQSIINYNEIDCKILWEIINYLRNNHTCVNL